MRFGAAPTTSATRTTVNYFNKAKVANDAVSIEICHILSVVALVTFEKPTKELIKFSYSPSLGRTAEQQHSGWLSRHT